MESNVFRIRSSLCDIVPAQVLGITNRVQVVFLLYPNIRGDDLMAGCSSSESDQHPPETKFVVPLKLYGDATPSKKEKTGQAPQEQATTPLTEEKPVKKRMKKTNKKFNDFAILLDDTVEETSTGFVIFQIHVL